MNGNNTRKYTARLGALMVVAGMLCVLKPTTAEAYVVAGRSHTFANGVTKVQRLYYNPYTGNYRRVTRWK